MNTPEEIRPIRRAGKSHELGECATLNECRAQGKADRLLCWVYDPFCMWSEAQKEAYREGYTNALTIFQFHDVPGRTQ